MQTDGHVDLADVIYHFAMGISHFNSFQLFEALQEFDRLPSSVAECAVVWDYKGRCYFEKTAYTQALECFRNCSQSQPHRFKHLNYYSTTLWHLHLDVDLALLAKDVLQKYTHSDQADQISPYPAEIWVTLGNCFSLQNETEWAVAYFSLAINVNPDYGAAYTLYGHEVTTLEKFEEATSIFKQALALCPRDYRALYGLGVVAYRKEEYQYAQKYFSEALRIQPHISHIYDHLGMASMALGQKQEALRSFYQGSMVDPSNVLLKFHHGLVWFELEQYEEALFSILSALDLSPSEPNLHYKLAVCYCRMYQTQEAMRHFNIALELSVESKERKILQNAVEKVQRGDLAEVGKPALLSGVAWPGQCMHSFDDFSIRPDSADDNKNDGRKSGLSMTKVDSKLVSSDHHYRHGNSISADGHMSPYPPPPMPPSLPALSLFGDPHPPPSRSPPGLYDEHSFLRRWQTSMDFSHSVDDETANTTSPLSHEQSQHVRMSLQSAARHVNHDQQYQSPYGHRNSNQSPNETNSNVTPLT